MNDYFQNHDDVLPSTQADFQVTESYRWVRIGLFCLLAGYIVFAPGIVLTLAYSALNANGQPNILILLLGAAFGLLGIVMIGIGGLFLLKSPQENERAAIRKVFIAYGIAIGCVIAIRLFDLGGLEIGKRIAQAYGTWFLINYFEVLAANRENELLQRSSNLLNRLYIIGILAILAMSFVGAALGVPLGFAMAIVAIFGVAFYALWLRTIWLAIKATRFIPSDSARVFPD